MREKTKKTIFIFVLAVILPLLILSGCSSSETMKKKTEAHDGHDHGAEKKGDTIKNGALHGEPGAGSGDGDVEHHEGEEEHVRLNDKELKEFGITLAEVGMGTIDEHVNVMGEIVVDPKRIAHMSPRFPGVVKEVRIAIGDRVKEKEVLATIESNESLVKYRLTSAINGTVIAMHMSAGENILDNAHHITVADLSIVWARFSIYQGDLFRIKPGQSVSIKANAQSPACDGTISYISPVVDETTRTASARVVLQNKTGQWKPGMFVAASVITSSKAVPLAVPQSALLLYNGQNVVMVKDKEGFRPQPVRIGMQNEAWAEILSGLKEGQTYVSKGAFLIKAELQKASFGDGHAH